MFPRTQLKFGLRILAGLLLAAAALLANDHLFFESVLVPSESMVPTLLANERGFLRRFKMDEIRRFDVVVFRRDSGKRMVKRVIGLPGECVELRQSWRVAIHGREFTYTDAPGAQEQGAFETADVGRHRILRQGNPGPLYETSFGKEPFCLARDEFYVLGDNRLASGDSRHFGPVKRAEIQGKLERIWYSYDLKRGGLRWERVGRSVN